MSESSRRHLLWRLELNKEIVDGVLILGLTGRISSRSAPRLSAALESEGGLAVRAVVIDLSGVDYISSAGLRVIETVADRMARQGGTLVLASLAEPVRIALDLAGFLTYVPVESSRERALARLQSA